MVDFKLNQQMITEMFCINKDKPIMMCSGKCYLADQLEKSDDKKEKKAPMPEIENLSFTYLLTTSTLNKFDKRISDFVRLNPIFENQFHLSLFSKDIFHPPQIIIF